MKLWSSSNIYSSVTIPHPGRRWGRLSKTNWPKERQASGLPAAADGRVRGQPHHSGVRTQSCPSCEGEEEEEEKKEGRPWSSGDYSQDVALLYIGVILSIFPIQLQKNINHEKTKTTNVLVSNRRYTPVKMSHKYIVSFLLNFGQSSKLLKIFKIKEDKAVNN